MNRVTVALCCLLPIVHSAKLLECLQIGQDSFLWTTPTVSKKYGAVALRFYNGGSANESVEVPLENGASIVDLPGFDSSRKTVMYIPGYKENVSFESVQVIVSALLKRGDSNVIVVDWSGYSTLGYGAAILSCIKKVPAVADVIKNMVSRGVPLQKFHLIGHSLGAHCAGYVGKQFKKEKLKIITGLDPAGPIIGSKCKRGLQKGDAEMVHIIHTDRWFYGAMTTCGDFDVFFNTNGERYQPGCVCAAIPFQFTFREACSHHRSWKFYAESIARESDYMCANCSSYFDFVTGQCGDTVLQAMYDADSSSRGLCYLTTNAEAPYGRGQKGARFS